MTLMMHTGLLGMLNTIGRIPYKFKAWEKRSLLGMLNTIGRIPCPDTGSFIGWFARYVKYDR